MDLSCIHLAVIPTPEPTPKVRSTGQLVEKIPFRSTEKIYHESGGKLEVFGLKHI